MAIAWFTLVVRIGDFLFLTYVNEYVDTAKNRVKIRLLLQCHKIQSAGKRHSDSYDKCESDLLNQA